MTATRKTAASPKTVNAAKKAEALHDGATEETKVNTFEYKGITYSVPSDPLDLPLEVGLAESEFEMIQEIVGPDQWLEFRKTRPTIRQFQAFTKLVLDATGQGDEGN